MKNAFYKIMILTFLLSGCAKSTPTETVIDNHVQLVNEVVDYANNNMELDADTQMLINALKTCKTGLLDAKSAYDGEISTCKAKKEKWQIVSLALFLLIVGAVFAKIKRVI